MVIGESRVEGSAAPMDGMSSQVEAQARAWASAFSEALGTCGNPTLDDAIKAAAGQIRAAAGELSGASTHTATFVRTCSANLAAADRGGVR